ncbi:MAG TPA: 2-amino-4-hydroxy-6-hydroxymethyldihydropteridine diphosphokinase, partial [Trueperaceae bacterium]|nr:2-amino-4-hydroxy-6-hydroxymethyldihydropteridine diphosphokinase [Trueperaceae bacterium]
MAAYEPRADVATALVAYVALGSNLGDSANELRNAAALLARLCDGLTRSSIYRTTPVGGPAGQADYLNAVVAMAGPQLGPRALLNELLVIERRRGRVRDERWGPRILDLDLLAYGLEVVDDPVLSLPHPRLHQRAFVLAPLCELAPGWRLPDVGATACALLARLPAVGVERTE